MSKEEEDKKYQLVDISKRTGWLDRQLRKVEEEVAKWPRWMLGLPEENKVYVVNYGNEKQ